MTPELKRARVSAGELAYADEGEGRAVVLLHGFPTSSFLWRREIPLLAGRTRVIAPDLLGYGASDKPVGADLSEPAQARAMEELLVGLGVSECAVVGHDIGGAVAQILALGKDVRVRTLVLVDSACFDAWPVEGVRQVQATPPEQETVSFVRDLIAATFELGMGRPRQLSAGDLAAYAEPWLRDPPAFFRAVRGIEGRGLAGRDEELGALDAPAFVLWGEQDPFLPSELGERLQDTLSDAALALLPGCSHFVTEDAPTTVGPLIHEFLRSRYLGERHAHAATATGPVPVFLHRPEEGGWMDVDPDDGG